MQVFRFKQFSVSQSHCSQKVGTDSDLLGALAEGGNRILDIGTGSGVLALMMAQRFRNAQITAVEIDGEAVIDAKDNFLRSPWAERLNLIHSSLENFAAQWSGLRFDAIVCNPPYFDRSFQCPDKGRATARHTSSLPFEVLVGAAFSLLKEDGVFSVILPREVLSQFSALCCMEGFWLKRRIEIRTIPHKPAKRFILIYSRARVENPEVETELMLSPCKENEKGPWQPSRWFQELMKDFLLS